MGVREESQDPSGLHLSLDAQGRQAMEARMLTPEFCNEALDVV
jgi:hypothetical protein